MWVLLSEPRHTPFDAGTDRIGRRRYVVNVDMLHAKETDADLDPTAEAALGEHLRSELGLVAGEDFLVGRGADLEDDVALCLRVVGGPGFPAMKTHGDLLAYPRSSVQLTVYGRDDAEAVDLANRAWKAAAFANQHINAAAA